MKILLIFRRDDDVNDVLKVASCLENIPATVKYLYTDVPYGGLVARALGFNASLKPDEIINKLEAELLQK